MLRKFLTVPSFVLAGLLVSCGGSSGTEPPPPSGTPASIVIAAGDQQSATAGSALSIAPAVLVRDADQKPIEGASVTFTVTSGGGTLVGATPVTDASGVARLGRWTLGSSGAQSIAAKAGNLAAVTFRAALSTGGTGGSETAIGASGGTVEITTAGAPYQGLKITVPPATFTGAGTVKLRTLEGQSLPTLPAGYQMAGPILEISTDQPRGSKLMTIDVPVTHPAGTDVVIVFRDPARGVMEVMPTISRTATSVRVVTTHLRGDLLIGPGIQPGLLGAGRFFSIGQLIPVSMLIPPAPAGPVVSSSAGRWPVIDHGSAQSPNGFSAGIAALQSIAGALSTQLSGMVTALATPGFYPDKGLLAAATGAEAEVQSSKNIFASIISSLSSLAKAERDALVHDNIVASLALNSDPVTVALFDNGSIPALFATVIAGSSTDLTLLNPAESAPVTWNRSLMSGFSALATKVAADLPPTTVTAAVPVTSFTTSFGKIGALMSDVQLLLSQSGVARQLTNDAMGAAAGIAAVPVQMEPGPGLGFSAVTDNTVVVRGQRTTIRIPLSIGGKSIGFVMNLPTTGAEVARVEGTDLEVTDLPNYAAIPEGVPTEMIASPFARVGGLLKQVSAQLLTVVKAPFKVTPDSSGFGVPLTALTFTASVPHPPASGYGIEWQWGNGFSDVKHNTATATYKYDEVKDYLVIATLFDEATGADLAVDTVKVTAEQVGHWRLTSISDQDNLFEPGAGAENNPVVEGLKRVIDSPSVGLISVSRYSSSNSELVLRTLESPWDTSNPFPSVAHLDGERDYPLGRDPAQSRSVGPFFAGWNADVWSQSSTNLNIGTMSGQYLFGIANYTVKGQGAQAGPSGATRITATRSSQVLIGVITVYIWFPNASNEIEDPPEEFRFPFTAVRLR